MRDAPNWKRRTSSENDLMIGPKLIARALSEVREFGPNRRRWQYNSRSDRHSSISCWAILFDLMRHCGLLRDHIRDGKVGFGINHEMRDFHNNKEKRLDLVVCRPSAAAKSSPRYSEVLDRPIASFVDLADDLKVPLTPSERNQLLALPTLPIVPVGMVHVALEAKAAMTEFSKAKSRLFSELDSSITVMNGHASHAIASALVMVNVASEFRSSTRNRGLDFDDPGVIVSKHLNQPRPAEGIIDTVRQLRRRSDDRERGFDSIGIIVVEHRNDGSPCVLSTRPPAPPPSDTMNYAQMISRAAAIYGQRFASV